MIWKERNPDKSKESKKRSAALYRSKNRDRLIIERHRDYQERSIDIKEAIYTRRKLIHQWFLDYCISMNYQCEHCGFSNRVCLDFHHIDTNKKTGLIGVGIRSKGWSKTRVLRELAECITLCANCHRVHHSKGRPKRRERAAVWDYKTEHPCACGENRPPCLDFHHRNPDTKLYEISEMISASMNRNLVMLEISKCDIICANCHRIHHLSMPNMSGGIGLPATDLPA